MYAKRSSRGKRRVNRRRGLSKKRVGGSRRPMRSISTNTASVRENYTIQVNDGTVTFFNNVQLADAIYDRSQAVAQAFQEFRIKYVKLTFKPTADTFPLAAGNQLPQLYFMMDKCNATPTNATLGTLLDMGARPIRFDDKNITRVYKPTVLVGDKTALGVVQASQIKVTPWLSTNNNAGNPGPVWTPSQVDHLGCLWYVTKLNPATPTVQYSVDVEIVFQFRKPLWRSDGPAAPTAHVINGQMVLDNQPTPA